MEVQRAKGSASFIDVLDRVLDKGIVVDSWFRISLAGLDLMTIEGRTFIASIETYLTYSRTGLSAADLAAHQSLARGLPEDGPRKRTH
jgi:hypothetical protein